jgi:molecular chaperone Hsp33
MLPESRLYSFIDQNKGFTLHFLEGQKLIHDVALIHGIHGAGFHFFRDTLLSTQMLLAFLKPGEGLGIYLDIDDPLLKFKIEMNEMGQMRTLLLPEDLNQFPKIITGKCRLTKTSPGEKAPYTSIVDIKLTPLEQVINLLLRDSYQLKSKIFLSKDSDQALMISKLPSINIDKIQTNYTMSVEEYWQKNESAIFEFFKKFHTEYSEIQSFFESLNTILLSTKDVKFKCTCSRERMVHGLFSLVKSAGIDHVFMQDENEIQTKCDYCHTIYTISRNDLLN